MECRITDEVVKNPHEEGWEEGWEDEPIIREYYSMQIERKLLLQVPTEDDVDRCTPPCDFLMLDRVIASALAYIGALVARCELLDKQMIHIESRLSKLESIKRYVSIGCQTLELPTEAQLNKIFDEEIDRTLPASLVLGDKE